MATRADLEAFIAAGGVPDGYLWPELEWCPAFWTQMETKQTLGDDVIAFVEQFAPPKTLRAEIAKRGWKLEEWQKFRYRNQFELDKDTNLLRYREYYFSVAKQNGKSWLEAGAQLYWLVKSNDVMGYRAFNFASSRRQADEIFAHVCRLAESDEILSEILKVYKGRFIENILSKGSLYPLANNFKAAQGSSPVYVTADEIWSMYNLTGDSISWKEMYEGLVQSSGNRDESMVSMTTTAGDNLNCFAYQKYIYGKQLATGQTTENSTFGAMVWEADEDADIADINTWKQANPNLATGVMSLKEMEATFAKVEAFGSADFERFRLNKWLRHGNMEGFILESFLQKSKVEPLPFQPGEQICIGFDGSQTKDATAIVGISLRTGFLTVLKLWEKDPRATNYRVNPLEVEAEIDLIYSKYDVKYFYGDPSKFYDSFNKWIKKHGRTVRDEPPTISRFQPYSQKFREGLYDQKITWADDKVKDHFLNAVVNWREMPVRVSRNDNKYIDILIASIYAWAAVQEYIHVRNRNEAKYGKALAAQEFGYNFDLPKQWL